MADVSLRRSPDLPMEFEVDGDLTLYPRRGEEALLLNSTASRIWRRLATPTSLAELVADLATSVRRPEAEVEPHVAALVDVLVARGLVLAHDEGSTAG